MPIRSVAPTSPPCPSAARPPRHSGSHVDRHGAQRVRANRAVHSHGSTSWRCLAPAATRNRPSDRKSVEEGKRVSVRVDLGGRRLLKKTKNTTNGTSNIREEQHERNTKTRKIN